MRFYKVLPDASPYHPFDKFFPLPAPPSDLFPEVPLFEQLIIPGLEEDDDRNIA